MNTSIQTPSPNCPLCPRLADFREQQRALEPDWFNAPVPSFGDANPKLLIVGLAPGLRGANRTGRPFTGDYAGDLLYGTLLKFGFAEGTYEADPKDSLRLKDTAITNAVRCVPPQNKPLPAEIKTCNTFLSSVFENLSNLHVILALGRIAHDATLRACGDKLSTYPFRHGDKHQLTNGLILFDSYHCSRYNTNTGRLTQAMFESVFADISACLAQR